MRAASIGITSSRMGLGDRPSPAAARLEARTLLLNQTPRRLALVPTSDGRGGLVRLGLPGGGHLPPSPQFRSHNPDLPQARYAPGRRVAGSPDWQTDEYERGATELLPPFNGVPHALSHQRRGGATAFLEGSDASAISLARVVFPSRVDRKPESCRRWLRAVLHAFSARANESDGRQGAGIPGRARRRGTARRCDCTAVALAPRRGVPLLDLLSFPTPRFARTRSCGGRAANLAGRPQQLSENRRNTFCRKELVASSDDFEAQRQETEPWSRWKPRRKPLGRSGDFSDELWWWIEPILLELAEGTDGRKVASIGGNARRDHLPAAQRRPVGPTARTVRTEEHCARLVPALGCSRDLQPNWRSLVAECELGGCSGSGSRPTRRWGKAWVFGGRWNNLTDRGKGHQKEPGDRWLR